MVFSVSVAASSFIYVLLAKGKIWIKDFADQCQFGITRAAEDMQGGGTFDSSGAFRDERWSDEEDADGKKKRVLKRREHDPQRHVENGTGAETPTAEPPIQRVEQSVAEAKDAPGDEPPSASSPVIAQRPSTATPPSAGAGSPVRRPESTGPVAVRVDEDGLEHAQAVVSTLVAQLVEDEDQPKPTPSPPVAFPGSEQWLYRLVFINCSVDNMKIFCLPLQGSAGRSARAVHSRRDGRVVQQWLLHNGVERSAGLR